MEERSMANSSTTNNEQRTANDDENDERQTMNVELYTGY